MSTKSDSSPSEQEKLRKKSLVLTHKRPSQVRSIADAMVIKDQDIFFLCERDGQIPIGEKHGFGLFYHDCRFLNGYALRLDRKEPQALVATARRGVMGSLQLINPGLEGKSQHIDKGSIGIKWERLLDGDNLSLFDEIEFENFTLEPVEFSLELAFQAHFEDIFQVRGMEPQKLRALASADLEAKRPAIPIRRQRRPPSQLAGQDFARSQPQRRRGRFGDENSAARHAKDQRHPARGRIVGSGKSRFWPCANPRSGRPEINPTQSLRPVGRQSSANSQQPRLCRANP